MLDYCLECLLYILLHSVDVGRNIGFSGEKKNPPACATNFITMSSLYRVHLAMHVNKIHKMTNVIRIFCMVKYTGIISKGNSLLTMNIPLETC